MLSAFAHGPRSLPSGSQSVVGSDTAELLMQDCRRQKYKRQNPASNLIGLTEEEWVSRQPGTLDLITGEVPPVVETQAQIVEKFTKLLYYGRKKVSGEWDPGHRADSCSWPLRPLQVLKRRVIRICLVVVVSTLPAACTIRPMAPTTGSRGGALREDKVKRLLPALMVWLQQCDPEVNRRHRVRGGVGCRGAWLPWPGSRSGGIES